MSKITSVSIWRDEDTVDPRKDYDHSSHMICDHRRYNLGDEKPDCVDANSFEDAIRQHLKRTHGCGIKDVIMLPVFLYDHGGLTLSTTPFSCSWDSGQVGYIYEVKKNVREEFGKKLISSKLNKTIVERLQSEIEVCNLYLSGNNWGYTVESDEGDEDHCGGFLTDDIQYMRQVIREATVFADNSKEYQETINNLNFY